MDYNDVMNIIRLRIFVLWKKLEEVKLRARCQSFYFFLENKMWILQRTIYIV